MCVCVGGCSWNYIINTLTVKQPLLCVLVCCQVNCNTDVLVMLCIQKKLRCCRCSLTWCFKSRKSLVWYFSFLVCILPSEESQVECLQNDQLSHRCVTLLFHVLVMRRLWACDVSNDFLITCSLLAQLAWELTAKVSPSCLMCASVCLCTLPKHRSMHCHFQFDNTLINVGRIVKKWPFLHRCPHFIMPKVFLVKALNIHITPWLLGLCSSWM